VRRKDIINQSSKKSPNGKTLKSTYQHMYPYRPDNMAGPVVSIRRPNHEGRVLAWLHRIFRSFAELARSCRFWVRLPSRIDDLAALASQPGSDQSQWRQPRCPSQCSSLTELTNVLLASLAVMLAHHYNMFSAKPPGMRLHG
jgi:hypothetical protein